jgi:hypothetical protein
MTSRKKPVPTERTVALLRQADQIVTRAMEHLEQPRAFLGKHPAA